MSDKIKDAKERKAGIPEELDLDALEEVSGGENNENPFAGVKRVTTHEIDDKLRNNI